MRVLSPAALGSCRRATPLSGAFRRRSPADSAVGALAHRGAPLAATPPPPATSAGSAPPASASHLVSAKSLTPWNLCPKECCDAEPVANCDQFQVLAIFSGGYKLEVPNWNTKLERRL